MSSLTADQKRVLLSPSARMSQAAQAFHPFDVPSVIPMRREFGLGGSTDEGPREAALDAGWLGATQLAKDLDLPLWCDDVALRTIARDRGIRTFGTIMLMHVLTESSASPEFTEGRFKDDLEVLLSEYVVDLPVTFEQLRAQAQADAWGSRAAATVFARPGRWADSDTEQLWTDLLTAVWEQQPDRLQEWIPTAAFGVAATDPPARLSAKVAALVSLMLVRVTKVGPEPLQLLWPTAVSTFMRLHNNAVHRALLEGSTAEPQEVTMVDSDEAAQKLAPELKNQLVAALVNGDPGFGFAMATMITESAMLEAGLPQT